MISQARLPTDFLSHGGGLWPWLKAERGSMRDRIEASLCEVRRELGQAPRAVLMIHHQRDFAGASSVLRYRFGAAVVRALPETIEELA